MEKQQRWQNLESLLLELELLSSSISDDESTQISTFRQPSMNQHD